MRAKTAWVVLLAGSVMTLVVALMRWSQDARQTELSNEVRQRERRLIDELASDATLSMCDELDARCPNIVERVVELCAHQHGYFRVVYWGRERENELSGVDTSTYRLCLEQQLERQHITMRGSISEGSE